LVVYNVEHVVFDPDPFPGGDTSSDDNGANTFVDGGIFHKKGRQ
jgi:hypothetical protein